MSAKRAPPPWWYDSAREPPFMARLLASLYGGSVRARPAEACGRFRTTTPAARGGLYAHLHRMQFREPGA